MKHATASTRRAGKTVRGSSDSGGDLLRVRRRSLRAPDQRGEHAARCIPTCSTPSAPRRGRTSSARRGRACSGRTTASPTATCGLVRQRHPHASAAARHETGLKLRHRQARCETSMSAQGEADPQGCHDPNLSGRRHSRGALTGVLSLYLQRAAVRGADEGRGSNNPEVKQPFVDNRRTPVDLGEVARTRTAASARRRSSASVVHRGARAGGLA